MTNSLPDNKKDWSTSDPDTQAVIDFNHKLDEILIKTVDLITDLTIKLKEKQGTERKEVHALIDKTINQLLLEAKITQIERVLPKYRHDLYGLVHTLEKDLATLKQQLKKAN